MIDSMRSKTANPRTVAIVVFDELSLFEFAAASEIFGAQSLTELTVPWYELLICGRETSIRTDRGLRIGVPHPLARLDDADTVVVPPSEQPGTVPAEVLAAVRRAHSRGARIVSLCTGAFILAEAGLLDGRCVTTHWQECDALARAFPNVRVDANTLYTQDGNVWTSAGSAASIDLCLHLVRQDYGAAVASELARELVVPPYRDGGQAQYIRAPLPDPRTDQLFTGTLAWLQENLAGDISVADLAGRSAMSRRTFARRFADSTGTTPYQWLLRQRVALAQRFLENTDEPIDAVAEQSGLGTAANLRKQFARVVNTNPLAYRRTFRGARVTATN
jgi:AraC family transcriptional regulator, transcriptional activator FtrA